MISRLSKLAVIALAVTPLITFAQDFVPLVGIPFMDTPTRNTTLGDYANAFYIAAISLGAVIAVLKIIFAGVKYMLSDVITDKRDAKNDIRGALLGLILIIGAVLILNTISPNITSLQAFNLQRLEITRPVYVEPPPPQCNVTSGCDEEIPTCSDTESLIINTSPTGGVTYTCEPRDQIDDGEEDLPEDEDLPEGSGQQSIQYICETVQNPNGCLFPDSFNKSSAEATCRNLSSTGDAILYDDPARLGWGICYYNP